MSEAASGKFIPRIASAHAGYAAADIVMAGLVPAIHVLCLQQRSEAVARI